jgi:hypothetical protein
MPGEAFMSRTIGRRRLRRDWHGSRAGKRGGQRRGQYMPSDLLDTHARRVSREQAQIVRVGGQNNVAAAARASDDDCVDRRAPVHSAAQEASLPRQRIIEGFDFAVFEEARDPRRLGPSAPRLGDDYGRNGRYVPAFERLGQPCADAFVGALVLDQRAGIEC